MFYYKQTTKQISLIQIYRRLLQHVLTISYSHLHEPLIYKINSIYRLQISMLPEDGNNKYPKHGLASFMCG